MKKMKFIATTTLCATLVSLTFACGNGEVKEKNEDASKMEINKENEWEVQKVSKTESAEMTQVISNYLKVSDALIKDDEKGASISAGELYTSVNLLDSSLYQAEKASQISSIRKDMMKASNLMTKAGLKEQRELFEDATKQLQSLIQLIGTDRDLYLQYCPMYKQNQGGYWLSEGKDILNPLFGSGMLKCGVVKKEYDI